MKTFLIDYRRPDGREDFKVVEEMCIRDRQAICIPFVEFAQCLCCRGFDSLLCTLVIHIPGEKLIHRGAGKGVENSCLLYTS